jgi:hypothetical protein
MGWPGHVIVAPPTEIRLVTDNCARVCTSLGSPVMINDMNFFGFLTGIAVDRLPGNL